jgi:hypothetical protein
MLYSFIVTHTTTFTKRVTITATNYRDALEVACREADRPTDTQLTSITTQIRPPEQKEKP